MYFKTFSPNYSFIELLVLFLQAFFFKERGGGGEEVMEESESLKQSGCVRFIYP